MYKGLFKDRDDAALDAEMDRLFFDSGATSIWKPSGVSTSVIEDIEAAKEQMNPKNNEGTNNIPRG